jgi:hypothetical protein
VSGHGVLLERRNGCIVKPLEKIVVAVVVADMVKTEIEVLTFEFAAARSPVGARTRTAWPCADRVVFAPLAALSRLYANTIEIFRVEFHPNIIMTERGLYRNSARAPSIDSV